MGLEIEDTLVTGGMIKRSPVVIERTDKAEQQLRAFKETLFRF